MDVRKAGVNDIDSLVELMQLLGTDKKKARSRAERYDGSNGKLILITGHGRELTGFVGMRKEDDDKFAGRYLDIKQHACLTWIGVHPCYRHRDIGTALLNACEDVARKWGKSGIWLDCKEKVLGFYQESGYQIRGRYLDGRNDRFVLAKSFG